MNQFINISFGAVLPELNPTLQLNSALHSSHSEVRFFKPELFFFMDWSFNLMINKPVMQTSTFCLQANLRAFPVSVLLPFLNPETFYYG